MRLKRAVNIFVLLIIIVVIGAFILLRIARAAYPLKYSMYIKTYSKKYDVDPYLVAAVIKAESRYNPKAKSHKDAYGLMQITSTTAEWAAKEMKINDFSTDKLYDPELNINMGCWYISNLRYEFKNDTDLVLASYNGGRGNVRKWLADTRFSKDGIRLDEIPFKETDQYIKRVKVNYNIYKFLYSKKM